MKKPTKKLPPIADEIDLRRWCIEQAIRWPWDAGTLGSPGYAQQLPPMGRPASQPDVLSRATQLLNWVKTAR